MNTAFGLQRWLSENNYISKLLEHIVELFRNNYFRNCSEERFTKRLSSVLIPFTSALLTNYSTY